MSIWKLLCTAFDVAEGIIRIAADDGREFLDATENNRREFEKYDDKQLREKFRNGHLNYSEKKAISEIVKERRNK